MPSRRRQQQQQQRATTVYALLLICFLLPSTNGFGGTHPVRRLALRELRAIDTSEATTTATAGSRAANKNSLQKNPHSVDSSTATPIQVLKENQVLFGQETTTASATTTTTTTADETATNHNKENNNNNHHDYRGRALLLSKALNSRTIKQQHVHKKTRQQILTKLTKKEIDASVRDSIVPLRPSAGIDMFEHSSSISLRNNNNNNNNYNRTSIGILGDRPERREEEEEEPSKQQCLQTTTTTHPSFVSSSNSNPAPGTVLLETNDYRIRTATPQDDHDIALLRLSVFSDFTPAYMEYFCNRSQQVLRTRRDRGATCLVVESNNRHDDGSCCSEIYGSMECSIHEFYQTELGYRRPPQSCLYLTEVAVHPNHRRKGVGKVLLKALDQLVQNHRPFVETIYLHVDVTNTAALNLYEQAGYQKIRTTPVAEYYKEFTFRLNLHDGATRGRNHYLLSKPMVDSPTWYTTNNNDSNNNNRMTTTVKTKATTTMTPQTPIVTN
eukprot:CAMPEP_0194205972 /NCGR_PEP_ID=MMETSP0156-20130528/5117_1 /TAXON_ID=33649 /ORGANISM="Thalassionema nitzschioides, Strain L26-B" /LENGTH=497 /DNA_ID=CAMNT_0038932381 /DNA_START=116 /DNA_END=1612 /DNA_ORIENTATION=-